jgi:hypothetical protein
MMKISSIGRYPAVLLFSGWLLVAAHAGARQAGPAGAYSLLDRDVVVVIDGTAGPFQLPDRFLLLNSETVRVDGVLLARDRDYRLDYDAGQITFTEAPAVASTVWITYQRLPFDLQERYFYRAVPGRQDFLRAPGDSLPGSPVSIHPPSPALPPTLRVGGSKTFAISVGSQRDLSLEQSLRVNISGQVSPDVEVVALLSDQSSPLQPEGDTQTLEEIDKVLVEIRGRSAAATLGDYEIFNREGEFGRFERKLQGAKGTARASWGQLTAAGAVSKGTFRSMSFTGVEGKQGPYRLTDHEGNTDIIVVAGTERIWVDGEQVTRGQNNDYIIEYGNGEVTFTQRRLITAQSRIVVDYEYSSRQYQRSFYGGQGSLTMAGDGLKLQALLIRESEDGDSPIDVALTDADRRVLAAAGDDPQKAWRDGWVLADTAAGEKGNYIWVDSTYFLYVGPDSTGIYQVTFSDVGTELGQYSREFSLEDNQYYYVYQGEDERRYLPRIYLPLAGSHTLADVRSQWEPWSGARLSAELGVSNRDENTFSALDDGDNSGRAIALQGSLADQVLRFGSQYLGLVDLTGRVRYTDERFRPIGRTEDAEYYRRWDLDRDRSPGKEEVREISGTYRPREAFSLGGEYGSLSRGDRFSSTRRRLESEWAAQAWPHLKGYYEIVESRRIGDGLLDTLTVDQETHWERQGLTAERALWKIRPAISWESETREVSEGGEMATGDRYQQYRGAASTEGLGALLLSTEWIYRQNELYRDGWLKESLGRTLKSRLELQNWRSLTVTAEYTRRTLRYQETEGTNSQVDLIRSRTSYSPLKGAVRAQLDYQVANRQASQRRRIPIEVGEGQGDYRLEDGEYIPDPDGNWIFRVETVGDSIPITDLEAGIRLGLTPHRAVGEQTAGLLGWLRNLSTDTYLKIDEETTEQDKIAIYLLQLDRFQRDETTVRGEITYQQDIDLFPQRRDVGLRLRYLSSDRENNQYITGGEENLRIERSVRLDLAPGNRPLLRIEYAHQNRYRKVEGTARSRIRADDLSAKGTIYPSRGMELSLESEWRGDRDAVGETSSRLIALSPGASYSFLSQGRLRTEFTWAHVTSDPEGSAISWEMAQGNRVGNNYHWSLTADYQINQYVSATLSYTLRAQPGRDTRHTGRAEMRAFF